MALWVPFYVYCNECGHRNRPSNSPREGIRMALMGELKPCTECGQTMKPKIPDRPLVNEIQAELLVQGIQPVNYTTVS